MSVQCNTYVILGVKRTWDEEQKRLKLPDHEGISEYYDKWTDSAFNPKKLGLVALVDGMSCNYIIVGQVLASTENYEGFHHPLKCRATKAAKDAVKEELKKHFRFEEPKVSVWVVTHYR